MSTAPTVTPAAAAPRPSVIQLVFREKGALYAAYMPVLTDGGLFVPTAREYRLGDDIYLLLSLPDDPQRYPVAGKIAWINAAGRKFLGVERGAVHHIDDIVLGETADIVRALCKVDQTGQSAFLRRLGGLFRL